MSTASLREKARLQEPDFPWLESHDSAGVEVLLSKLELLQDQERLVTCELAGEGNMNLTLRVTLSSGRSLIVKQARPWVEKYDHIAAPVERIMVESQFYRRVANIAAVAKRMPAVLATSDEFRVLVLQDMGTGGDYSDLYQGRELDLNTVRALAHYLRALHDETQGVSDEIFRNRAMRELNHAHIFCLPLSDTLDMDLGRFEPRLPDLAAGLRADTDLARRVHTLGHHYLEDGPCLLHGDFFPGSWLRSAEGPKIIDPEFCFLGERAWDLGVCVAHLRLSGQEMHCAEVLLHEYNVANTTDIHLDAERIRDYAAVEIIRRLLGVAQLPIPPSSGARSGMVLAARRALLGGTLACLWH